MRKQKYIHSLGNAFRGMFVFFSKERNGQIQLCIAILVLMAGMFFRLNPIEWIGILLCIAMVLSLEMLNTALEKLSDMVEPNYNLKIKAIKDIAAAAVLWTVMISVVIGAIIFIPKIMSLF